MDDTHHSRTSDVAAATRKRRSSILKSQRPPRTPFSELEFNVATPTDAAKSRRVSFSRRTGVAEFITNEATTTWKNFYEEHNKSLESSGNESGANAPRPIGHIGKRIFDQQFQEVEAVDFGSTHDNHPNRNINTSINNVNFTQQLASLECTGDDRKLSVPQQNFEMSALTDHQSKLFSDDLAVPTMGEMSGHIDVNFSAVQTIGEVKDDLDEIQNDLQRAQSNVVCPGPFTGRRSMSEYIEVDLNATHVSIKNDDDDMSITDTIHSPKVQDVSKSNSSIKIDNKLSFSKDWVADKENIALNPYVTPKESTNFAINDESDKILVFDGKRLTVQSDKEAEKILKGSTDDLKPTLPKEPKAHQRKTIVLNTNDDLPNFIDDPHMSTSNGILSSASFKQSVMYDDDDDLTFENKFLDNRKTIPGNDTGNISTTQAISSNIILSENVIKDSERSEAVYENIEAEISMTEVLPSKIIGSQDSNLEPQRRRTILYENDVGEISITQAISANIIINESKEIDKQKKTETERRQTILYDNDMGNVSMTQAIPANILINEEKKPEPERRRTILYDNDMGNISMTQAIPVNILVNKEKKPETERRRTILYDNDMGNISVTQAIPANIILNENKEGNKQSERRRTIIYDNDMGNISVTQAIPANIIVDEQKKPETERRRTILYDNDMGNISMTQVIPANILVNKEKKPETERRKTIIYDNDMGNVSVTQAIPANIILNENREENNQPERRKTIIYNNDMGNISVTQAIPANILVNEQNKLEPERRKTIVYDNDMGNISMTQAIPANIFLNENKGGNAKEPERRRTILNENDMVNISMTQAIPANIILNENNDVRKPEPERRRTIIYDNDMGNISMTQAIPANIIIKENKDGNNAEPQRRRTILYDNNSGNISMTQAIPPNIIVNENKDVDKSKTILYEKIDADISMTQAIPTNLLLSDNCVSGDRSKRQTIIFESEDGNISVTLPSKLLNPGEESILVRRKTIPNDNDSLENISITQTLPANIFFNDKSKVEDEKSRSAVYDNSVDNVSNDQKVRTKEILPAECDLGAKINIVESETSLGNISTSRASFTSTSISNEKRKTILHEDKAKRSNITITTVAEKHNVSKKDLGNKINIVSSESDVEKINIVSSESDVEKINIVSSGSDLEDISSSLAAPNSILLPNGKRKTIVFEHKASNISVTQTLTEKIFGAENRDKINIVSSESDEGDISITRAVPTNILLPNEKRNTIVNEDEAGNLSVTRNLPTNILGAEKCEVLDKRKTILYESNPRDISVNQAVLVNVLIVNNVIEKRKSITYDNETVNALADTSKVISEHLSDVQVAPAQSQPMPESGSAEKDFKDDDEGNMSLIRYQPTDLTPENKPSVEDNRTSSDGLIYIIRDTEDETQTDKPNKNLTWKDDVPKIQHSPLSLEYKEDVNAEASADLPKKLNELKSLIREESSHVQRIYEKIVSSDEIRPRDKSESEQKLDISKGGKSFKDANDTDELLEMLSDLTDKSYEKEPEKPVEKIETIVPKRLSVAPNRLSSVLSREDLLNNISMAQAALQRSPDTDESINETSSDTPLDVDVVDDLPSKPGVRVSNEVVKKLQFEEDESASDASIKSDLKSSPLKKTAFGETSYMKESKAKVIPSYLKDVSDEIKALMNDLVKPNMDSEPFQKPPPDRGLKRAPSTCSTQIQANLITSSQIDLDTDLSSATESGDTLEEGSGISLDPHSRRSPDQVPGKVSFLQKKPAPSSPSQERVIVFDPFHPLNNVLLGPLGFSNVHKYNPHKSNETLISESLSEHSVKETDSTMQTAKEVDSEAQSVNEEKKNTQFVGSVTVVHSMHPSGDSVPYKYDTQSLLSDTSKPTSIDESVSVRVCELKDTKVNTVIAMKANIELLEESSSLTLVDDALAHSAFDVNLTTAESSKTNNSQRHSPVKVIYHNEEPDVVLSEKVESDFNSTVEIEPVKIKGKKRVYSPTKNVNNKCSATSSVDVTPKPITKMQKISKSLHYKVRKEESPEKLTAEKDEDGRSKSTMDVDESDDRKPARERKRSPRKSKSPKSRKPGTSVTVQQLLTKFDIQPDIDQNSLNKKIIEALSRSDSSTAPNTVSLSDVQSKSLDVVSSFTSSKNQKEMREACSATTTESRSLSSKSRPTKMDWQPEVVQDTSSNIVSECESSVNVVAKIDMLPFMGSHECEWEASGIDTWSFRLLHARLRLSVRLAHRHDNATRTRVRADTPVQHVSIDTAHSDKKNSVASLCVRFALEAMRYFIGRGCSKAGDVPALLKRCAGVARVALRWGRAMHEARLHLACVLGTDGRLALKVANIPLRSVWEVTMRLELVVEDAREVPWPRACDVRVSRVVSDVRVSEEEVKRVLASLPRDWGHAPRAVWKIFRYLKNKTREDDLLGM